MDDERAEAVAGRGEPVGVEHAVVPEPPVEAHQADEADQADQANEADEADQADQADEADEADEAHQADQSDEADQADQACEAPRSRKSDRSPHPTEQAAAPYGSRREARERALSLLYEADAKGISPAALLVEIPVEPPPFVTSLVAGVGETQAQIDELIGRYAIDWTIERMPVIDRMIVRIATFELLGRPDVPTGVVISEAVELAKRYSTDESGRFVNGVLASIAAEIRPPA